MAKKKATGGQGKAAAKAAKKVKAVQKVERKQTKKVGKSKDFEDEEDLEKILDDMRREWEEKHAVTEEVVEGPPSRRANATLTACPSGNYLWCIGGEFFSEDGKAYFYHDVYRYTPEKDEWRKFVSPTCPGPRSAHAVVGSPAGGGKLFLFGGEFSSLHQNSFHHYRDFWCFDISTHVWDRIDTKVRPSSRSGCRMALWKHYIILFGGFYDPGIRTNYLNDLWYFDTQEYQWKQVEFKEVERRPSPRSGFSFLPTAEGIILHGGYCKEYTKGKRPVGVMLEDTWFLKITLATPDSTKPKAELLTFKWEKRKKVGYPPSIRSGCTMAMWANKATGVLFGGVTDEDNDEETLESVFHNDLFGYQITGNGRWISLTLRKPKKQGGVKVPKQNETEMSRPSDVDPDDPSVTIPLVRYNAMLAVLRNTLYIYGGIYERGSKEYTLDDFYALQLDKMDRYTCLKPCDVEIPTGSDSSSEDEDSDGSDGSEDGSADETSDEDEDDEGATCLMKASSVNVRSTTQQVSQMLDVSSSNKPTEEEAEISSGVSVIPTLSPEDALSTPFPGESLAQFYNRTRDHWAGRAHESRESRGKELRRDGFSLAQDRYVAYKPMLEEVEKILAEAGLDEDEIKRGAINGDPASGTHAASRNRR